MKIQRLRRNALYSFGYGCSVRKFKKLVRSSPDNNIKRVRGRELAWIISEAKRKLAQPWLFR